MSKAKKKAPKRVKKNPETNSREGPRMAAPQPRDKLLAFVESLKRQWVAMIDALIDPLMIVDTKYKITKANLAMARMAGESKTVQEILGKNCYSVFAKRKSPCPGCGLSNRNKDARSVSWELEPVREERYFEVISQKFDDDSFVHAYRDRTEARRMQAQLLQNDKLAAIGQLAGGIAHEINNPLGGILIFSQMLLREMPKDSQHYPDIQEIEAATQRCKQIVEGLLEFARQSPIHLGMKNSKSKPPLQSVHPLDAIKTALKFATVGRRSKFPVEIEEKYSPAFGEAVLRCDRNKLVQVILNLLQNAFQAMPDGGYLTLKGDADQKRMKLTVQDTGHGIPERNIKKIFDPFYTTKEPGEGTGLGLAICYGIMQEFGGEISVESKLGKGTSFTISMPVAP